MLSKGLQAKPGSACCLLAQSTSAVEGPACKAWVCLLLACLGCCLRLWASKLHSRAAGACRGGDGSAAPRAYALCEQLLPVSWLSNRETGSGHRVRAPWGAPDCWQVLTLPLLPADSCIDHTKAGHGGKGGHVLHKLQCTGRLQAQADQLTCRSRLQMWILQP